MVISYLDINRKRKECSERFDIGAMTMIGQPIQYFFVVKDGEEQKGICGINGRILGLRPPVDGEEVFHIDLALELHVEGFYSEELNVKVVSMTLEDQSGKSMAGVCRFEDIDEVMKIMNDKFVPDRSKRKLQLVVDNSEDKKE